MRHIRLSLKTHVFSLLGVSILSLVCLGFGLHKSVLTESVYAFLCIWGIFTLYFWFVLYCGLRFDRGHTEWSWPVYRYQDAKDLADKLPTPDVLDLPVEVESIGGWLLACVIFILYVCFASFAIALLLWLGVNFFWIVFLVGFLGIYWIFRRGLRLVLLDGRKCRGDFPLSLIMAALHSFVYAFFFGGLLAVTELLARHFHKLH